MLGRRGCPKRVWRAIKSQVSLRADFVEQPEERLGRKLLDKPLKLLQQGTKLRRHHPELLQIACRQLSEAMFAGRRQAHMDLAPVVRRPLTGNQMAPREPMDQASRTVWLKKQ